MRILISTFSRDVVGGVETYLRALLPRLAARGHEVSLLHELKPAAGGGRRIDEGVALSRILSVDELGRDGALAEVRRQPPDVVYQHGLLDPELEQGLLDRAPAVLYAHSYYGACVSGTKRFAFPRRRMCHRPLGPLCLVHYPLHRCGGRDPRQMIREYRLQRRRQRLLRRYAAVLVASRHMAAELERNGVAARLAPHFPPALRPDPSPPAPRPRAFRLLFAGRLTAEKGVRFLWPAAAAAAARLGHPLTLAFAGTGPEEAWLRAAPPSPWVRAELLGWADRAALEAELRRADLLAVPSVWPEPFGLVGVEAACLGVPSVAYQTGGIADWLTPGKTGEVAPGEVPTVRGLADALVRALGDEAHWQALRVGAWEASGRFTPEAHLAILDAALEEASARR